MRLVHLSDLHLGYRQYQRVTPAALNQREADVARAAQRAINATINFAPDVVVLAGDIFHSVRPTNPAIVFAFQQFARLARALPNAAIVMIAGNHDTPRAVETGGILRLFAPLGIHIVDQEAQRLAFPDLDLSILAVPDVYGERPALVPDPEARFNVLVLHGEIAGLLPRWVVAIDRAANVIMPEELHAEQWTYVALGHSHVYQQVASNAYYSGATEYTSANIWGELAQERETGVGGKGLIVHDLATGAHRFQVLEAPRGFVDLPWITARGMTAADVDARIRESVDGCRGGIEGRVVRLVVRDLPRHIARELDHRAIREYKRRALHFLLDARRPESLRIEGQSIGWSAGGRRPSLADIVRDKLQSRLLEGNIDRDALVTLGLKYLADAETVSVPTAVIEPDGED